MRCPNCSADCAELASECEFCGHVLNDGAVAAAEPPAPPVAPSNPNRATYTSSEPTYSIPEKTYTPPPPTPTDNPYAANYPSSSKASRATAGGSVPNYLVWAILATLCCCLPAGIVAIVYAAQVDGKVASGDYYGAVEASNNAKMWSWISFGASAVVGVLYFLLILVGGVADSGRF